MASAVAILILQVFISGQMLLLFVISVCVVLLVMHLQGCLAARREGIACFSPFFLSSGARYFYADAGCQ